MGIQRVFSRPRETATVWERSSASEIARRALIVGRSGPFGYAASGSWGVGEVPDVAAAWSLPPMKRATASTNSSCTRSTSPAEQPDQLDRPHDAKNLAHQELVTPASSVRRHQQPDEPAPTHAQPPNAAGMSTPAPAPADPPGLSLPSASSGRTGSFGTPYLTADRLCLQGILYALHNDISRQPLPPERGFGSGQTCSRRRRRWYEAGVFDACIALCSVGCTPPPHSSFVCQVWCPMSAQDTSTPDVSIPSTENTDASGEDQLASDASRASHHSPRSHGAQLSRRSVVTATGASALAAGLTAASVAPATALSPATAPSTVPAAVLPGVDPKAYTTVARRHRRLRRARQTPRPGLRAGHRERLARQPGEGNEAGPDRRGRTGRPARRQPAQPVGPRCRRDRGQRQPRRWPNQDVPQGGHENGEQPFALEPAHRLIRGKKGTDGPRFSRSTATGPCTGISPKPPGATPGPSTSSAPSRT